MAVRLSSSDLVAASSNTLVSEPEGGGGRGGGNLGLELGDTDAISSEPSSSLLLSLDLNHFRLMLAGLLYSKYNYV